MRRPRPPSRSASSARSRASASSTRSASARRKAYGAAAPNSSDAESSARGAGAPEPLQQRDRRDLLVGELIPLEARKLPAPGPRAADHLVRRDDQVEVEVVRGH